MLEGTNPNNQQQNLQTGPVSMNHGGHEVNDINEVLGGVVGILDQYMMFQQYIQDPELTDILKRQYQFMADEYNMLVQSFSTGHDPEHGTIVYQMKQSNDVIYGMKPSRPKKPRMSTYEINDECISHYMLNHVKAAATMKTMAALEVTNPVVRRVLADSIPNCIEMVYELFLYQNKHGYYQVPQYSETIMSQMLSSYAPVQLQHPMQ